MTFSDPPSSPLPAGTRPRRTRPRSRTIATARITREEIRIGAALFPPVDDVERPRTRGDCLPGGCNEQRPCPFVSCKHHLALDVKPETGSIQLNFPDVEPWDLVETCALDVADRGGVTLEEVGGLINVTRERIRQMEVRALQVLRSLPTLTELQPVSDSAPPHPHLLRSSHRRPDFGSRKFGERDAAIATRVAAGEDVDALAREYRLTVGHVKYVASGRRRYVEDGSRVSRAK